MGKRRHLRFVVVAVIAIAAVVTVVAMLTASVITVVVVVLVIMIVLVVRIGVLTVAAAVVSIALATAAATASWVARHFCCRFGLVVLKLGSSKQEDGMLVRALHRLGITGSHWKDVVEKTATGKKKMVMMMMIT